MTNGWSTFADVFVVLRSAVNLRHATDLSSRVNFVLVDLGGSSVSTTLLIYV